MIYLDSSAVVKLVRHEGGSPELVNWLNQHRDAALVVSAIAEVEVTRAIRRSAPDAMGTIPGTMGRLYRVEIDATVRSRAGDIDDASLRTLDAVHLATAAMLGREVQAFVTYDQKLAAAAERLGLPVTTPGERR